MKIMRLGMSSISSMWCGAGRVSGHNARGTGDFLFSDEHDEGDRLEDFFGMRDSLGRGGGGGGRYVLYVQTLLYL